MKEDMAQFMRRSSSSLICLSTVTRTGRWWRNGRTAEVSGHIGVPNVLIFVCELQWRAKFTRRLRDSRMESDAKIFRCWYVRNVQGIDPMDSVPSAQC